MANRYSHAHAAVAQSPATIDEQIKCITGELERFGALRQRKIASGEWHPEYKAEHAHRLRSVLLTLQRVRDQRNAYATKEDQAA